jgi:hypothetical protein
VNESTKQVGDKIIDKFKQEIAEISEDEALKQFAALKLQLSNARIPIPREFMLLIAEKQKNHERFNL